MVAVVHPCLVVIRGVGHRLLLTLEDSDVMPAPCEKPGNVEPEDAASDDCDSLSQFSSVPHKNNIETSHFSDDHQNSQQIIYAISDRLTFNSG